MRSSGCTNVGLAGSVVARMKSRIACFAGPSFHDASGVVLWAYAVVASRSPGSAGMAASPLSINRRLRPLGPEDGKVVLPFCQSPARPPENDAGDLAGAVEARQEAGRRRF